MKQLVGNKIPGISAIALAIAFGSAAAPTASADRLDSCQISINQPPPLGGGDCYFLWWVNQQHPNAQIPPDARAAFVEAGHIPCRKILNDYNGNFYAYYRDNPTVDLDFVSVAITTYCPSLAPR